jgi:hypothetical protein
MLSEMEADGAALETEDATEEEWCLQPPRLRTRCGEAPTEVRVAASTVQTSKLFMALDRVWSNE